MQLQSLLFYGKLLPTELYKVSGKEEQINDWLTTDESIKERSEMATVV